MLRRSLALAALAISFAGTAVAGGRAGAPPVPTPPGANICVTSTGWCDLPSITAPLGYQCACLTADNAQVEGVTRYLPHTPPFSPYLRPHTPATAPSR